MATPVYRPQFAPELYEHTRKTNKLIAEDRIHSAGKYNETVGSVQGIRISKTGKAYVVFLVEGKEKSVPYSSVKMADKQQLRKGDVYTLTVNNGKGDARNIAKRVLGWFGFKSGTFQVQATFLPDQQSRVNRFVEPRVSLAAKKQAVTQENAQKINSLREFVARIESGTRAAQPQHYVRRATVQRSAATNVLPQPMRASKSESDPAMNLLGAATSVAESVAAINKTAVKIPSESVAIQNSAGRVAEAMRKLPVKVEKARQQLGIGH